MLRYIISRILFAIPLLLLVATVVFFAFRLIPGDSARVIAGEDASIERVEQVRQQLGLDRPVLLQYTSYLLKAITGDLGTSFMTRRPVALEIGARYWNTFSLALVAVTFATIAGVAMGVLSALNSNGLLDHLVSLIALIGISMPVFWLGLLLMDFFAVRHGLLPAAGYGTWKHFIMPGFTLSVFSVAFITRITRSSLLETIGQDYVRTARAKGVGSWQTIISHALRNALVPITIVVGLRFGYMVGGAVITEEVFAWPGLGRLLILSVAQRDIPLVQGLLLVFSASFIAINLAVDLLYSVLDPRTRYS